MSLCPFPAVSGLVDGCFLDGMFLPRTDAVFLPHDHGSQSPFWDTATTSGVPLLARFPSRNSEGGSACLGSALPSVGLPGPSCHAVIFLLFILFSLASSPPTPPSSRLTLPRRHQLSCSNQGRIQGIFELGWGKKMTSSCSLTSY